jgi:hypothetical protein
MLRKLGGTEVGKNIGLYTYILEFYPYIGERFINYYFRAPYWALLLPY